MSDAPTPDTSASDATPVPSAADLERDAIPATYRVAPRLMRVIGTGAIGGAVFGALAGVALPGGAAYGRGMAALLAALGFGMIGALTAGTIATAMDTRSVRRTQSWPHDAAPATEASDSAE